MEGMRPDPGWGRGAISVSGCYPESNQGSLLSLGLHLVVNEVHSVPDGENLAGLVVWDLDIEAFFEFHHQLD